jgi:CRISPR-associated protein Cas1
MLSSESLGAIARIDLLEVEGGLAVPVDYKRGALPDTEYQAQDPERVQLCLQGLILRDNGYVCDYGILYFAKSRTRVEVPFTDELETLTREAVEGLRKLAERDRLPPPLIDSPKCVRCSLVGICLPDETNRLTHPDIEVGTRRLVAADDDRLPLYVQEQGTKVGKSGEKLIISQKGETLADARLLDVSQVVLLGNVQVTSQAVRALCEREVPITYFSYGGWFYGMTTGAAHKNIELRIAQHRKIEDGETALAIARSLVAGKIQNQRTLLRRNLPERDKRLLAQLGLYARQARHAPKTPTLLGIEGMAARLYYGGFSRLLRGTGGWAGEVFSEAGRNRRPPRDEVNAVLSFVYSMLVKECTILARSVGFEIYRGFYHAPKYGRPALPLDLCEEFRPILADSTCMTLFNQGEVKPKDFIKRAHGVALTRAGRRAVLAAWERRLSQTVTHPVFGYTINYRRTIELQARLLRAVVLDEIPAYRPFTTR